jgi:hypothetical protein
MQYFQIVFISEISYVFVAFISVTWKDILHSLIVFDEENNWCILNMNIQWHLHQVGVMSLICTSLP